MFPSTVYPGALIRVRVEGAQVEESEPAAATRPFEPGTIFEPETSFEPGTSFHWEASGGLLHFDDLEEIRWRSPATPGRQHLAVAVKTSERTLRQRFAVDVEPPKRDGMRWIAPGVFLRGDVRGTQNFSEVKTVQNASDEPCHEVYLDGFWIDRFPVTNEQYKAFLDECLAQGVARVSDVAVFGEFDGSWVPFYYFQSYVKLIPDYYEGRAARKPFFRHVLSWDGSEIRIRDGHARRPVVDVTWFGSAAYARFFGKKLPSEAQWEKAARGTDARRFPWGNNVATSYHVNLENYYGGDLTDVGTFSPRGDSPYGVADLVSNCFEWTNDWFNPDYYPDHRSSEPLRNPEGPFWGSVHGIRGLPSGLNYGVSTIDQPDPVSSRYHWEFEFFLGDSFANGETCFRTVLREVDGPYGEE